MAGRGQAWRGEARQGKATYQWWKQNRMSRTKEQLKEARRLFKLPRGEWEKVPLSASAPSWMTRCFINNRYCVMIDDNGDLPIFSCDAIKAMVQKHDDTPIQNHWREMQRIKNELFGAESVAIEFYPKQSELVDHANIYWMWVIE
jgi:hypothetical protein